MTITIYDLSKDTFDEVTRDLSERWFIDYYSNSNEVYTVELNQNVTISNGIDGMWLDLAGRISQINYNSFSRIEIK